MDISTVLGLFVGIAGIIIGNAAEGGHFGALLQFTAAMIVFGGTIGATLVSNRMQDVQLAFDLLKKAFGAENEKKKQVAGEILAAALLARKESILSIEPKLNSYSNPFMRKVFRYVVDGVDVQHLRHVFEESMHNEEERLNAGARVWLDAGGFAPTIGIIGAVIGLIHVMGNLRDTDALGAGIAVAFVATIYGVAAANLVFIPLGNKLKRKIKSEMKLNQMVLEGAASILQGHNPYLIEEKIRSFLEEEAKKV